MKTVLKDGREVAHVWAHQGQSEGRAGNVFFRGKTIYSYGMHFPMGEIVERKGKTVVLITTTSYSPSTSKHIGYVRSATSHMTCFNVPPFPLRTPQQRFLSYQPRVLEEIKKASTARLRREWHLQQANLLVVEANAFAAFFGLKSSLKMPANIEAALEEAKAIDAAAKRKEEARFNREQKAREKNEANSRAEALAAVESWKRGKVKYLPHDNLLETDYLRLSSDGKDIETSHIASVPVAHAHRAYKLLALIHARRETYKANGYYTIRCGHYNVDWMEESGRIKIGCHIFEWSEVSRLANLLNWANTEPVAEPESEVA